MYRSNRSFFGMAALCAFAVSLAAPAVRAETAQWIINTSTSAAERTFDGAADWFDAGNWTNGFIASGAGVRADFWTEGSNWDSSGIRYVKVDRNLTVGTIRRWWKNTRVQSTFDSNRRVVLMGDNTLTLDGGNGAVSLMQGVAVYGNIVVAAESGRPKFYLVDFCGPFENNSAYAPYFSCQKNDEIVQRSRFRRDLWADGTSEGITNFAPTAVQMEYSSMICFYAPEGSDGVGGTWRLTEGSPLAYRVGDAHAISAGTVVTGDGVPEGAYVKRIYSDAIMELSAPATATSDEGGTALAFAAFRPKAYQRIDSYSTLSHGGSYRFGFWPQRHSAEDEMTVELFDLKATSGTYHFHADCEDGFLPGRLVLHNTSAFKNVFFLGTCEVEFAATTNNTAAGFPNNVRMQSGAAGQADVARVIVPDGVEASFGSLTNVVGTFIKAGEGSLTAPAVSDAAFAAGDTGRVVVEEGTLVLTCAAGDPIHVNTLSIADGATLTIPSCGVEATAVLAEAGAAVDGTGFFYAVETNDLSGISFGAGVTVVRLPVAGTTKAAADVYWETNVTAGVVGSPALWFDASRMDTFEFADETVSRRGYEDRITKWYDVRGVEYGCATCFWKNASTPNAQFLYTNALGEARMVMVYGSSSTEPVNRNVLQWDRQVTGIRSVFKVVSSYGTTGIFFGGSNRGRGSSTSYAYNKPIFSNVPELYTNSLAFYVNGDRRDWREGYPYGILGLDGSSYYNANPDLLVREVAELHFPDATTYAHNFGYNAKTDNGRDYMFECIVYTNELSEAERLSVRKYLMNKWLDGMNYAPAVFDDAQPLDAGSGAAYRVEADEALVCSEITGEGALAKYGEGTLVACKTASNALHVAEGRMTVRALSVPTRDALPGNAYLHLDASDEDTLVVENGKVVSWADVRGEGYPTATALNAGKGPAYEEHALNDMPVVDFGPHNDGRISTWGATCPTLVYDPVSNAHSVVAVLVSTNGGGPLLGWHVQSQMSIGGYYLWGLDRNLRYSGTNVDNPIVWAGALGGHFYDLAFPLQAGGSRVRLNGAEIDGTTTPFTGNGEYDMVSLVSHRPIRAGAIGQVGYSNSNTYFNYGGYKIAEMLVYTNVISRAEVKAVEAYLSRKWFNRASEDYEPAAAKTVAVDAGATLEVWGGAPLSVGGLSGAGTVSGKVAMEDGAVLEAVVNGDGSLSIPDVTGGLDLLGGGTVELSGAVRALRPGSYALAAVGAGTASGWTATSLVETRKTFKVSLVDGTLRLEVGAGGVAIIIR